MDFFVNAFPTERSDEGSLKLRFLTYVRDDTNTGVSQFGATSMLLHIFLFIAKISALNNNSVCLFLSFISSMLLFVTYGL